MIVADSNVIVYLAIQGEKTALAAQAFEKDNQWVSPLLWRSEFLSVVALHIRKGILSTAQARQVVDNARNLIQLEYEVDPQRVLDLITSSKCSAYDCEFVALAKELDISVLTEDHQILQEFPEVAVSLAGFLQK